MGRLKNAGYWEHIGKIFVKNPTKSLTKFSQIAYNKENIEFLPITFRPRQGGTNSINLKKIIKIGIQAVKDFGTIKKTLFLRSK